MDHGNDDDCLVAHLNNFKKYLGNEWSDNELDVMYFVSQRLRDTVATGEIDVHAVVQHTVDIANTIYSLSCAEREEKHWIVCRRLVQVLANSAVAININTAHNNTSEESPIWAQLKSKPEFWTRLLSHADPKLCAYSSMLLYNTVHSYTASLNELVGQPSVYSSMILSVICTLKLDTPPEWNLYLLEKLLSITNLIGVYRNALTPQDMHILLDVIGHQLDKKDETKFILEENLNCISSMFSDFYRLLGDIETTVFNAPGSETWQLMRKCLSVLSKATACIQYFTLRNDHRLFKCATEFLHRIVDLGKKEHVLFRPKVDLDVIRKRFDNDDEGVCPSIIYGLKQDLVRVIGNMCESGSELQKMVEEMHVVELLLDCTVCESENPLLTHWSVLAIRHLCVMEANRNVIARLQPVSSVLHSPIPELDHLLKAMNINNG